MIVGRGEMLVLLVLRLVSEMLLRMLLLLMMLMLVLGGERARMKRRF